MPWALVVTVVGTSTVCFCCDDDYRQHKLHWRHLTAAHDRSSGKATSGQPWPRTIHPAAPQHGCPAYNVLGRSCLHAVGVVLLMVKVVSTCLCVYSCRHGLGSCPVEVVLCGWFSNMQGAAAFCCRVVTCSFLLWGYALGEGALSSAAPGCCRLEACYLHHRHMSSETVLCL